MSLQAFTNARMITPAGIVFPGTVIVKGSRISRAGLKIPIASGCKIIDLQGAYLGPGLVDLHLHGALGYDFMEAGSDEIRKILRYHRQAGSTTVLATTVCAPWERLLEALAEISAFIEENPDSGLWGLHLEGPYINPEKSGALNTQAIRSFDRRELDELLEYPVKTVTIAPECFCVEALSSFQDVSFSIGHTAADYATTRKAIQKGIRYTTHYLNTMPPIHHREPGAALALLQEKEVSLELIADSIHIHPEMLKFLYNIKGADRIILVSDAAAPTGCSPGSYPLWGKKAVLSSDNIRFEDGTLAGSCLTLLEMMRRMMAATGCKLSEAFTMASCNPARRIGLHNRKGRIAEGMDADLVILDKNLNLLSVMAGGKIFNEV